MKFLFFDDEAKFKIAKDIDGYKLSNSYMQHLIYIKDVALVIYCLIYDNLNKLTNFYDSDFINNKYRQCQVSQLISKDFFGYVQGQNMPTWQAVILLQSNIDQLIQAYQFFLQR